MSLGVYSGIHSARDCYKNGKTQQNRSKSNRDHQQQKVFTSVFNISKSQEMQKEPTFYKISTNTHTFSTIPKLQHLMSSFANF